MDKSAFAIAPMCLRSVQSRGASWVGDSLGPRAAQRRKSLRRCRAVLPVDAVAEQVASAAPVVITGQEPVTILHITDSYVVVNKPAGVLVHRTELTKGDLREIRYLNEEVRQMLIEQHDLEHVDLNVVHRLDRATSGVMLFAFGSGNAAAIQHALQQSETTAKEYWTVARTKPDIVVSGFEGNSWTNNMPLKNLNMPKKKAIQQDASTSFTRLLALDCSEEEPTVVPAAQSEFEDGDMFEPHQVWVIRAELGSGRRHQIRRHLSFSRLPILGDSTYGKGKHNRYARAMYGFSRLALHSRRLTFREPDGGQNVTYSAPVPVDLRDALAKVSGYTASEHDILCDLD
jgi:tRNA pseudouridine65 synthase